jgi:hypothetical protein
MFIEIGLLHLPLTPRLLRIPRKQKGPKLVYWIFEIIGYVLSTNFYAFINGIGA